MRTDFSDAVSRLSVDRPKQFVFTCEVVLREDDVRCDVLDTAIAEIRTVGSFEIVDVEILDMLDPRKL